MGFENVTKAKLVLELIPLPSNASMRAGSEKLLKDFFSVLKDRKNYEKKVAYDVVATPINYTVLLANSAEEAKEEVVGFLNASGVNDYYFEFNLTKYLEHYVARNFTFFAVALYEVSANKTILRPLVVEFNARRLYLPLKALSVPRSNGTDLCVAVVSNATLLFEGETYTTRVKVYGARHYYLRFYATKYYYGLDADPIMHLLLTCSKAKLVKKIYHLRLRLQRELDRLGELFAVFNYQQMLLKIGRMKEVVELNYIEVLSSMDYQRDYYGVAREMFSISFFVGSKTIYFGSVAPMVALIAGLVASVAQRYFSKKRRARKSFA